MPGASPLSDADGGSGGGRRRGKRPDQGNASAEGDDSAYNRGMNRHLVGYVQGLSTAFLDATVKRDPVAREWLERNATRWLAEVGEFRIK
jgi:hypothetical protein